jgi:hypothetical protein
VYIIFPTYLPSFTLSIHLPPSCWYQPPGQDLFCLPVLNFWKKKKQDCINKFKVKIMVLSKIILFLNMTTDSFKVDSRSKHLTLYVQIHFWLQEFWSVPSQTFSIYYDLNSVVCECVHVGTHS